MAFIDSLPSGLAEWLGGQNELGDIDFTVDFPANIKKTPLRYPVVAVGLKKCTVTPPVDVNGQPVNNIHKEALAEYKFSMNIPVAMGGAKCYEVYMKILDRLLFNTDFTVLEAGCGEISFVRETEALCLTAYIRIKSKINPEASYSNPFVSPV